MGGNGASSKTAKNGLGLNPKGGGGGTMKVRTIGNISDFLSADFVESNVAGDEVEAKRFRKLFETQYANLPVIAKLPAGAMAIKTGVYFHTKDGGRLDIYRSGSRFDSSTIEFAVRVTKAQKEKQFVQALENSLKRKRK